MTRPLPPRRRRTAAVLTVLSLSAVLAAWQPSASPPLAPTDPSAQPEPSAQPVAAPEEAPPPAGAGEAARAELRAGYPSLRNAAEPTPAPTADPATSPELAALYSQELSWQTCSDGPLIADCATAVVPLDYTAPGGTPLSIALKRIPALDGRAELGTLLLNPGGPGASGVEAVEALAEGLPPGLRASYDIVGFDPRGVGSSTHLTCWTEEDMDELASTELGEEPDASAPEPSAPPVSEYTEAADAGEELAAACREHSSVPGLIDHMSTQEVARDLDLLRAVMGEDELNYLGYSYGTVIGAVYAELFPSRVGRVVLDGAADPTLTRIQWVDGQLAIREERMRAFIEFWRTQPGSPLSGSADEAVEQVVAHLQSIEGTTLPYTDDAGAPAQMPSEAVYRIFQAASVQLEEFWPALVVSMNDVLQRGQATRLHRLGQFVGNSGILGAPTTEAEAIALVAYRGVTCADDPLDGDPAIWAEAAETARERYPLGTLGIPAAGTWIEAFCHGWGATAPAAPQPLHATGAPAILVIGATGDPNTPYQWAQSLSSQLESAHLLSVDVNWHTTVGVFPCPTQVASDYLMTGALPRPGMVCAAQVNAGLTRMALGALEQPVR